MTHFLRGALEGGLEGGMKRTMLVAMLVVVGGLSVAAAAMQQQQKLGPVRGIQKLRTTCTSSRAATWPIGLHGRVAT